MFLRISSFKVSYEPKRVQEVFELVAAAQLISRFYIWGPNGQYVFVKVDSKDAYEVMKSKRSLIKKIEPFLSSIVLDETGYVSVCVDENTCCNKEFKKLFVGRSLEIFTTDRFMEQYDDFSVEEIGTEELNNDDISDLPVEHEAWDSVLNSSFEASDNSAQLMENTHHLPPSNSSPILRTPKISQAEMRESAKLAKYVNAVVVRQYEHLDGYYPGLVVGRNHNFWHVVYDDGDSEDYDTDEVEQRRDDDFYSRKTNELEEKCKEVQLRDEALKLQIQAIEADKEKIKETQKERKEELDVLQSSKKQRKAGKSAQYHYPQIEISLSNPPEVFSSVPALMKVHRLVPCASQVPCVFGAKCLAELNRQNCIREDNIGTLKAQGTKTKSNRASQYCLKCFVPMCYIDYLAFHSKTGFIVLDSTTTL